MRRTSHRCHVSSGASARARSPGKAEGLDRPIYFTNEEVGSPAESFDGLGGLAVAIFDNQLHRCLGSAASRGRTRSSRVGRRTSPSSWAWRTVRRHSILPSSNSQLYMYVGKQRRQPGSSVLASERTRQRRALCARPVRPGEVERGDLHRRLDRGASGRGSQCGCTVRVQLEAASDAVERSASRGRRTAPST